MKKAAVIIILSFLLIGCAKVEKSDALKPEVAVQQKVTDKAVQGNTITIVECHGNPEVLKANEGWKLIFKNADVKERTVHIDGKNLTMPFEGSTEITAKFSRGKSIYQYSCDNVTNAGTIIIE